MFSEKLRRCYWSEEDDISRGSDHKNTKERGRDGTDLDHNGCVGFGQVKGRWRAFLSRSWGRWHDKHAHGILEALNGSVWCDFLFAVPVLCCWFYLQSAYSATSSSFCDPLLRGVGVGDADISDLTPPAWRSAISLATTLLLHTYYHAN